MAKEKKDIEEEELITLNYNMPSDMAAPFCTDVLVQRVENVFKMLFFERRLPFKYSQEQEVSKAIDADCVGGVYVSPTHMRIIIDLLQAQMDLFDEKIAPIGFNVNDTKIN